MSGLRERMNRLRGTSSEEAADAGTGAAGRSPNPGERDEAEESGERLHPAWAAFGVKAMHTPHGDFLLRKEIYRIDYRHGTHALGELHAAAAGLGGFYPGLPQPKAEDILFLDLETTGLGVGAGNVPFMTGIAYLSEDGFVVEQALIRHPGEEYAMLRYLSEKASRFAYLATYNGKTFDWPLMQNRIIMNSIQRQSLSFLHLDFLHPSRSIWRNTLASCKLSHIEEERLGIERSEDVPGSLAPQLYFQYLADGDPAPLEGVFRHNASDLLSLACLAIRFGRLLTGDLFERLPWPEEAEELIRTGLWLERMGRHSLADELQRRGAEARSPSLSALLLLAERDKKAGNWERAVLLWQKAAFSAHSAYDRAVIEACTELAMYYEHKSKRYGEALRYAGLALEMAEGRMLPARGDAKRRAELEGIRKRIDRLKRKLKLA